jgi:predicted nucleic acid-binding protein
MKVFLDANILITVLNKEYPLFTYSSSVLRLSDNKKFKLYTSPNCLAIAFFFAEKKSGISVAKCKIDLLVSKIDIADSDKKSVLKAVENQVIIDFEDAMQYYSALHAGCTCIVTENVDDFYFSELEVMGAEAFLLNHFGKLKS